MQNKSLIDNLVFKHNKVQVDLLRHCLDQRSKYKNLKVFIGCDSVAIADRIYYFIVISFRDGKMGVHCIYAKDSIESFRAKDRGQKLDFIYKRLERECELTINLADYLTSNKIFDIKDVIVEFDYNEVPDALSNRLIGTAKGWAEYSGYQHLCKIPHNHLKPKRTPTENMVCIGNPELDSIGRPLYPEDWTDIQSSCRYADHLCKSI